MKISKMILFSCLTLLTTNSYAAVANNNNRVNPSTSAPCSTLDLSVFEVADEEQMYNGLGFSRGDIRSLYDSKYDAKNEMNLNGKIIKMTRVQFPDDNCYLIAVVKTDTGDFLVNLGPVWFADENNISFNEGDMVQIRGSKFRTHGRHILIASEVKKNGQTLLLRNPNGSPQWGSPKAQRGTSS